MKRELYAQYDDVELVRYVKLQQLLWLGPNVHMDEQAAARRVLDSAPSGGGVCRWERPFIGWKAIWVHTSTDENDDTIKEAFYECLDEIYDRCPRHNVKIVFGDFNAKLGKYRIFGPTVEKLSQHEE